MLKVQEYLGFKFDIRLGICSWYEQRNHSLIDRYLVEEFREFQNELTELRD